MRGGQKILSTSCISDLYSKPSEKLMIKSDKNKSGQKI